MSQCNENKIMENIMSAGLFERPRCEQGGFQTTPEDNTGSVDILLKRAV